MGPPPTDLLILDFDGVLHPAEAFVFETEPRVRLQAAGHALFESADVSFNEPMQSHHFISALLQLIAAPRPAIHWIYSQFQPHHVDLANRRNSASAAVIWRESISAVVR